MASLQFGGAHIHYEVSGEGPGVLLLHAFPFSAAMWKPQIEALSSRFLLVGLDLPGFGDSTPLDGPATMERFAESALAVLDAAGLSRVAVVGLSMGGYVAFALESLATERVAALALCDTRATPDTEDGRHARELSARAVEEEGVQVLVERMLPNLLSPSAPAGRRREAEQLILKNRPEGVAAAQRAMAQRRDFTSRLPDLTCPTLVVVGARDTLTRPEEAEALAAAIPGAELATIPDAGHLSNLEQPEAFNAALGAFLDRVLAP